MESAIDRPRRYRTAESGIDGAGEQLCYHCGLPVLADVDLHARIDGRPRAMCCHGCQAVAEAIVAAGHENFYRVRSAPAAGPREVLPDILRDAAVYDLPEIRERYARKQEDGLREASLILEGITCAACVWLNERYIGELPGVREVRVNYATQRALVRWDDSRTSLGEILQAVARIGYRALPYSPDRQQRLQRAERRRQLRRLAVAGLFGMQVMMLSISLYAGAWSGMEREFEQLFRWLGLSLSLPVVLYSARPFFEAAWRDLLRLRVAMDLPVSLAIGIAFASSAAATMRGVGEVYFDSVVMFVFFLSASRYFESMARRRCAASVEKLAQSLPLTTTRIGADGVAEEAVAALALLVGDRVLVRPGETLPADGVIEDGCSAIDESLLSGESMPLSRGPGERVAGGSINITNPLRLRVVAVGADTVIAEIGRSIERAQAVKPPIARLADRIAGWFIGAVLLTVLGVAAFWWHYDPARSFEIALAVLIVSCPCALSLATPTAISAALGRMQSRGLLVRNASVLESIEAVTHVVFDKTGTLTRGEPTLSSVVCAPGYRRDRCLRLAAALERHSEHPLAKALLRETPEVSADEAEAIVSTAGGGVAATIGGQRCLIGSMAFVAGQCGAETPARWRDESRDGSSVVVLAGGEQVIAMFCFDDSLREDARELIDTLKARGKTVLLMSGDRESAVRRVAESTAIECYQSEMSPGDKMLAVQSLQAGGARVMMIGDGVNDAPVLAGADVSIAVGNATSLARCSADIVLASNRLRSVEDAIEMSAGARRVIRQNTAWALVYNFGAIPAAAAGLLAPWLAALGMSASSLVVVLNALRLTR